MDNIKYLNKVVDFLVKDTKINWEKKEFMFPFFPTRINSMSILPSYRPPTDTNTNFFKYFRNHYGLTDNEINYVWNTYKYIMIDKMNNGR